MQESGWSERRVRRALANVREEDFSFDKGQILGSMCTAPHPVAVRAHQMFLETNLGDPGHFPGVARMERELLDDFLQLLHAPAGAGARYLTGGTEANLLALYIARKKSGKQEVVVPESAHFSFDKAARLLDMDLKRVPTTPGGHAHPAAVEHAIGPDTALIVGVAGTTELGLVDPIEELAALAVKKRVLLHVDAAFGGYVIPFLESASRRPRGFDFALDGVWSIALDPHKMGMATIPGGVLSLRDEEDWNTIAVDTPYVSTGSQTSLMGTRPGGAVAAAWAVHRHLGMAGYASLAETCLDNTTFLAARLQRMGIPLVTQPELNVVTFQVDDPDDWSDRLQERGFRVNVVPRFSAIRIVVMPHVERRTLERFLDALATIAVGVEAR